LNIEFNLNDQPVSWEITPAETLLAALRTNGVMSVKRGCETGDCGACTVLLDGEPVNACVVAAARAMGGRVTTLEGLLGDPLLTRLQEAMVDQAAVQCGFCSPGMLISLYALMRDGGQVNEADIRHALTGNLCRCTGYVKPVAAALDVMAQTGDAS